MSFSIDKYLFRTNLILSELPESDYEMLEENMVEMVEKKEKVIYREGSYSLGVYLIIKGKVKVYQTNKEGKEQIAHIYSAGDIIGYRPLLCEEPHPVSAATLEDSVLSFIPRDTFMNLLEHSPVIARRLLTNLSHEFTVWINRLTVFGQQQVKGRLALSLLILSEIYKMDGDNTQPVTINLSRDDLANYSGTTVETLVRMIRVFKDNGIIITRGRKIEVLKPEMLDKMTDFS
jgi:CRP-like cAMP-binding protein